MLSVDDLPAGQPDRGALHVGALADALDTERRLLEELARVLVAQREGIARDDLQALDESVFAARRIFRTLQEARQRRRTLLRLVGAETDLQLGDLESALGGAMTPDLAASRDGLLAAAGRLQRELSTNRRVIDGAMTMGERLLELFVAPDEKVELYTPGADEEKGRKAGAILNTRV